MTASNVIIASGTTVSVSANEPATYDGTGFGALSFTAVGEVLSLGEFGGSAQVQTFTPLATGIVNKRKGSIDYGTANMSIANDEADAGQIILKAGFDGAQRNTIHSFKVENSDGDIAYFTGMISSFSTVTNDSNTIITVNCNIELTNSVVDA